LLIFVDDDNILDPNYLSEAITIGHNWPILGVWGSGAIIPEFEAPPAEYVKQLVSYLALRNTKVARWGNVLPCTDATPWGAGLCVRSKVADAYCKHNERAVVHISDRQGSTLLSGGDVEISYIANDIGLGMGIFPQLRLTHLIPKERVSLNYLLKIYEGTLISNLLLAYKWEDYEVVLASKPRRFLSRLKNLIFLRGIDRQIYLANRRAEVAAKTIISKSQTMPRGPKPNKADVMTEETL
jgi:hypothetical protein